MIAVGLMCGTSLDGIDAALVDIRPRRDGYTTSLLTARTVPFGEPVVDRLRQAFRGPSDLAAIARLDAELGDAFGDAALRDAADGRRIDFVASHGVTLYHDGDRALTWQVGDPFRIRERVHSTVLFDFRRGDCAAGGHGAPLVPYADALWFASPERFRVALNLGGIANVTLLAPGATPRSAHAWDVGPANLLLDTVVRRRTGGRERFDRDGAMAARGTIDDTLLRAMLGDPYFARVPPKSTGREYFAGPFLETYGAALGAIPLEDACATLVALSAQTVADAVHAFHRGEGDVIVSGGGVHNAALVAALSSCLPTMHVSSSQDYGVDPDSKEAMAFTVLGYELLRGRAAGIAGVTGARKDALLGAIAPVALDALLTRVSQEVRGNAMHEE